MNEPVGESIGRTPRDRRLKEGVLPKIQRFWWQDDGNHRWPWIRRFGWEIGPDVPYLGIRLTALLESGMRPVVENWEGHIDGRARVWPGPVNGCTIEPGADLHGADLSGVNLTLTRAVTRAVGKRHKAWQAVAVRQESDSLARREKMILSRPVGFQMPHLVDRDSSRMLQTARRSAQEKYSQIWATPFYIALGANLSRANLSRANLSRANLCGANLCDADLSRANLCEADLSGLRFVYGWTSEITVDLRGADLTGANLAGADLRGADLTGACLRGADLTGTKLTATKLQWTDVSGTDLAQVDLSSASSKLIADENTLWPPDFDPEAEGVVLEWPWCFRCDDPSLGYRRDPEQSFCEWCSAALTSEPPLVWDAFYELVDKRSSLEDPTLFHLDDWETKNCQLDTESCLSIDTTLRIAGIPRWWNHPLYESLDGSDKDPTMEFYVLQADRAAAERVITKYVDECERLAKNPPKRRLEESDPVKDPLQRKPVRPHIPASLRYEVMKRDQGKCQWCSRQAPDVEIHVDHIVPVSKGGETTLENLQLLCAEDNLAKSDRPDWNQ